MQTTAWKFYIQMHHLIWLNGSFFGGDDWGFQKERVKIPRVWGTRPFPRCQTQETLARDVFSFARFGIMWGFFFRFEATGWLGLCPNISVFVSGAEARTYAGFTRTNELSPHKCRVHAHKRPFCTRFGSVNTQLCAYSWPLYTPNTGYISCPQ